MRRAEVLAGHSGRPIADLLTEAIEVSLDPFDASAELTPPSANWSDQHVLDVADAIMSPDEDRRLSELLNQQQDQTLTSHERAELADLMRNYHTGLLQKAKGIAEAVRRGLRPIPLP